MFACPRWLDDRARLTEILRRPPNAGDVEDILCGPPPVDLPDDSAARERLIQQAKTNRHVLTTMIKSIMATEEEDESEDQAHHRDHSPPRIVGGVTDRVVHLPICDTTGGTAITASRHLNRGTSTQGRRTPVGLGRPRPPKC